jgi:putative transposase
MTALVAQQLTEDVLIATGLPALGIAYVIEAATSPPAHKVGRKRRRNLILDVPLKSIPGVVLQAESLTGEFNFLVELDRRRDLLAVFDQPTTIRVGITDRIGRQTRTTYTADYLVVEQKRICAYEIKADHELEKLVRDRPKDWTLDKNGHHYLPAAKCFKSMGIEHVIVPISSLSPLRADNLRLLMSAREAPDTKKYRKVRRGIRELLKHESAMRISDVLERIGDRDETPILQLLDAEEIFADLDQVTLSDPSSVWISTSLELAKTAQDLSSDLANLIRYTEIDTDDVIDPRYELEVATRLAIIQGNTRKNSKGKEVSERTVRRYRRAFREALGSTHSLVPLWRNCGNHDTLIGTTHQTFLVACVRAGKRNKHDPSVNSCFNDYLEAFQQAKVELEFFDERPVSRSTFYTYWDQVSLKNEDSFGKGGRRLENEQANSFDPAKKTIIATRPFAVAHIDHWKTDLHLVVGYVNGAKITKRAWLTAMVDAFTGEVLAIWLSFADPSKKACTMVIRDCVRRHGRLPEMIIVDAGSDFRSVHFFVMLSTLKVVRCERPPEDPRFGQQVERLFKDFKERFARGLPGFGISIERARAVSAAFKAAKSSSLTLLEAFEAIEAFAFHGYNHSPKPGEMSSRYAFRQKAEEFYPHNGCKTTWDMKFLIATSIEPPSSDYKLWTGRGIHVYDKWYSSPLLLEYRGYKKDISVRLEPYADCVIYVCIEGKWLECRNSEAPLQFAMSGTSLLCKTAERQDLSALRVELANDMNRCVAEIVNEKLREIAGRKGSGCSRPVTSGASSDSPSWPSTPAAFNFDEIEPYDNETPQ